MMVFLVYWLFISLFSSLDGLEFEDILPADPRYYDKMQPPKKGGKATVVMFHVFVNSIDSIDEYSMTYVADILLSQSWKDHRLRLPDDITDNDYVTDTDYFSKNDNLTYYEDYDDAPKDYRILEVDWLNGMWRPDSFFKNAKQVTFQTMTVPNHFLWLYRDHTILYVVKLTLTLSCPMKFSYYPHDRQECRIQIESLSHTTADLVFQWTKLEAQGFLINPRIELPKLQLEHQYTNDCSQSYTTGNFTCLEIVFIFKRRLGYYLFHTYIPTCLIVIMSWVSFWIQPEGAPARVTLGVTSLLTLGTQHAKSQATLPPVSDLKVVDAFLFICYIFVFMALMEYCVVNVCLGDYEFVKSTRNGLDYSYSNNQEENSDRDSGQLSTLMTPTGGPVHLSPAQRARIKALQIDRFSRLFFPLSFFIINTTYWLLVPYWGNTKPT